MLKHLKYLKLKLKGKISIIWEVDSENLVVSSCPDLKGVANTSKRSLRKRNTNSKELILKC